MKNSQRNQQVRVKIRVHMRVQIRLELVFFADVGFDEGFPDVEVVVLGLAHQRL